MNSTPLPLIAALGTYQFSVETTLRAMQAANLAPRLWAGDHTLWKPDPTEISNRLGWLTCFEKTLAALPQIDALTAAVRSAGYTHALLLGMGGSSLAPEVLRKTFGVRDGYLDLAVLDSTTPEAVLAYADRLDMDKTLFIVSTKSGGTVETFSFFRSFYNRVCATLGAEQAGEHFIAITDPGSKLAEIAAQLHFRACFLNDPNIGGRYSALSFFGMLPAALVGVEIKTILERAQEMAALCQTADYAANPAVQLGAMLGELALAGRDKATVVCTDALLAASPFASFGDWVEQLVAESTGKEGKGILPVVGEPLASPAEYGPDRAFYHIHLQDDNTLDAPLAQLQAAGQPVIRLPMRDLYDLGGQFLLWELATAIASHRLGIQPFDQPDVESAKILARKMVAAYKTEGKLPELTPALQAEGITVYGGAQATNLVDALKAFLAQAQPEAYLALQAYLPPGEQVDAALLDLRTRLRRLTRLAVTTGYGPRFLHSTGQLHKGDAGKGLFIQLTANPQRDAPIPDEAGATVSSMSFGVLVAAQALGDRQALLDAGREVLRLHLGDDVLAGLKRLSHLVEAISLNG